MSLLIYNSNTNNNNQNRLCIFSNYTRCQHSMKSSHPFEIICSYHMNEIFSMAMKEDTLFFYSTNKVVCRKQVLSSVPNNKKLLPFPIKISPENEEGKICILDENRLYTIVREFIMELNLNEIDEKINDIIYLICGLITNGTCMLAPNVGVQLGSYMSFLANYHQAESLKLAWANIKVRCHSNGNTFLYPMTNLPMIYLLLLSYVEASTVRTTTNAQSMISIPANIYLDLDRHAFVLSNIDDPINSFCLNKEGATYTSPLILAGERQVTTSGWPSLFNRSIFGSGSNMGHPRLINFCTN